MASLKTFWSETTVFADLGDGRMDGHGFSAKYCTYTFMEYISNILVMVFVDKRNTNFKSTNMESADFEKGLGFLIGEGLNIAEVVTDANSVFARLMSKFDKSFVIKFVKMILLFFL